jgi:hypothetical protein
MYAKKVKEFLKEISNRTVTNKIEFFDNIPANNEACFNLGHVEICCATISNPKAVNIPIYENEVEHETLELQLKHITKNNNQSLTVRCKADSRSQIETSTVPIKFTPNRVQSKSVLDVQKFFQSHKIIGHEGTEDGEFRHPLGEQMFPLCRYRCLITRLCSFKGWLCRR